MSGFDEREYKFADVIKRMGMRLLLKSGETN